MRPCRGLRAGFWAIAAAGAVAAPTALAEECRGAELPLPPVSCPKLWHNLSEACATFYNERLQETDTVARKHLGIPPWDVNTSRAGVLAAATQLRYHADQVAVGFRCLERRVAAALLHNRRCLRGGTLMRDMAKFEEKARWFWHRHARSFQYRFITGYGPFGTDDISRKLDITEWEAVVRARQSVGWEMLLILLHSCQRALEILFGVAEAALKLRGPSKLWTAAAGAAAVGGFNLEEMRYRRAFDLQVVDKGLLRFLLRRVLVPGASLAGKELAPITLADFGANLGGYATWLNDTGLVHTDAYDGAEGIEEVTQGAVAFADLAAPGLDLGRRFDWVLCLEVAEHVPKAMERALVDNMARHSRLGVVLSWYPRLTNKEKPANYQMEERGSSRHLNEMDEHEVVELVGRFGLVQDEELTRGLRAATGVDYLKVSVAVYRKSA